MKISDLKKRTPYRIRLGRAGQEDVEWMPWLRAELYIQADKKGKIVLITPTNITWAEYRPEDYNPHYKVFECEGYYMQIEGLE